MRIHTLIPEAESYGVAIAVIFCLGCSSLTEKIYLQRLGSRAINFMVVHNALLGLIVVWGFLIFDAGPIFGNSVSAWLASFPLGLIAGLIAGWSDRAIVRYLSRRRFVVGNHSVRSSQTVTRRTQHEVSVRSTYFRGSGLSPRRTLVRSPNMQKGVQHALESQRFEISSLVMGAVLEELIYRGFLVSACFLLPTNFLIGIALASSIIIFALSHIRFGWPHVLAKLPLGALAMIAVLSLGTVLPAVVAHVVFNIGIWKDMRNQPAFLGSTGDFAPFPRK